MGPYVEPGLPNCQDNKTSSCSRQIYNKGKNNQEIFIYGPNVINVHFWICGGGGGGAGGGYGWAHLASQLSSHLNQSTCKI